MSWLNETQKTEKKTNSKREASVAYINKPTLEQAENDSYAQETSQKLLATAKEMINGLKGQEVTLKSTTKDGKPYNSKAEVNVTTFEDKNGETKYNRKITIPIDGCRVNAYAKPNGEIRDVDVIKFNNEENKSEQFKDKAIMTTDKLTDNVKAAVSYLEDEFVKASELQRFAKAANKTFSAVSDKTTSTQTQEDGTVKMVNNAYANYKKDEYGEKVELKNHDDDNVVIQIGITKDDVKYARAYNFDTKKDWYINKSEDLTLIGNAEIREQVALWKGLEIPEQIQGRTWESLEDKPEGKYLSYASQGTLELAKTDEFVGKALPLLMDKANEVMECIKKEGGDVIAVKKDGSEYESTAKVTISEGFLNDNGDTKHSLKISIPVGKEQLQLSASNDISDGIKLYRATALQFEGKNIREVVNSDIVQPNNGLSTEIRAITQLLTEKAGLVKPAEKSEMFKAYESIAKNLEASSEKVPSYNDPSREVANAYAKFSNEKGNEAIRIYNHKTDIVVELLKLSNGDNFVKTTNFDYMTDKDGNVHNVERDENGRLPEGMKYATAYVNTPKDLKALDAVLGDKSITQEVAKWKSFDLTKEKSNTEKHKPVERD